MTQPLCGRGRRDRARAIKLGLEPAYATRRPSPHRSLSSAAPADSPADRVLALVRTLLVSDQFHLGLGLGDVGGAQPLAHFDLAGGGGARRPAASSGARRRGARQPTRARHGSESDSDRAAARSRRGFIVVLSILNMARDQCSSELRGSPSSMTASLRKVDGFTVNLMDLTEPSPSTALMPPGWGPPKFRRQIASPSSGFGGIRVGVALPGVRAVRGRHEVTADVVLVPARVLPPLVVTPFVAEPLRGDRLLGAEDRVGGAVLEVGQPRSTPLPLQTIAPYSRRNSPG